MASQLNHEIYKIQIGRFNHRWIKKKKSLHGLNLYLSKRNTLHKRHWNWIKVWAWGNFMTLTWNWLLHLITYNPNPSSRKSGLHYLLDDSIGSGSIYSLDSAIQALNNLGLDIIYRIYPCIRQSLVQVDPPFWSQK